MKGALLQNEQWDELQRLSSARAALEQHGLPGTSQVDFRTAMQPVVDVAAACAKLASMPSFHALQRLLRAPIGTCNAVVPEANLLVPETLRAAVDAVEAAWSGSKQSLIDREAWTELLDVNDHIAKLKKALTESHKHEAADAMQNHAALRNMMAFMRHLQATAHFVGVGELQRAIDALETHVPCDETKAGAAKRQRIQE